jgi:hypothetical protein
MRDYLIHSYFGVDYEIVWAAGPSLTHRRAQTGRERLPSSGSSGYEPAEA